MIFRTIIFNYLLLNQIFQDRHCMKTKKILIAGAITLTALLLIHIVKRKKAEKKRLSVVAEEGYETAEDILFPKRKFLRLG